MKKIVLFFAACLFTTFFLNITVRAQESEDPGLILLYEEFVAPANLAQFWAVQQEAFDYFKEADLKMQIWAYQTGHNSFYWGTPLKNFASIDEVFAAMMQGNKAMKEKGFDGTAKFRDLSNISMSVLRWNPEISWHPEGTSEDGLNFHEWSFMYLKSGHEKEAAEAAKKYIEFYKSIDSDYAWDIYEVVLGDHLPCWILEVQAKDEATLRQQEAELNQKYGDDFSKLWENYVQHVRTIVTKKGWYLPNWSMNVEN